MIKITLSGMARVVANLSKDLSSAQPLRLRELPCVPLQISNNFTKNHKNTISTQFVIFMLKG